jgi:hypothetical protein
LTEEIMQRDHLFWSKYSDRLVGNWITYDTTAKELCDFVEKVYLRHDYSGFKGDPKFIRDEDAQKGFPNCARPLGPAFTSGARDTPKNPAAGKRLLKEAEFAFKQAFAYCPYSEGAYKYAQLLAETGRMGGVAGGADLPKTGPLQPPGAGHGGAVAPAHRQAGGSPPRRQGFPQAGTGQPATAGAGWTNWTRTLSRTSSTTSIDGLDSGQSNQPGRRSPAGSIWLHSKQVNGPIF